MVSSQCLLFFVLLYIAGSTCGKISVEECLDRIGDSINQALDKTEGVTVGKYGDSIKQALDKTEGVTVGKYQSGEGLTKTFIISWVDFNDYKKINIDYLLTM